MAIDLKFQFSHNISQYLCAGSLVTVVCSKRMNLLSKASQKLNLRLLVILAAGFQLWDAIITQVYVGGGYVGEGNPFMVPLLRNGMFLPERIFSIAVSVFLIYLLSRFAPKIAVNAAAGVILLYSGVLIWNYAILCRA